MKLTLKKTMEADFPAELLEYCQKARFNTCRLDDKGDVITQLKAHPAMTANGLPIAEHEDICEIMSFNFNPADKSGSIDAIVSLTNKSSLIKMRGEVVDVKQQRLLGALPLSPEVHDSNFCELKTDFHMEGNYELQPDDVAVLIWADWQASEGEHHVVVEHENNDSYFDTKYEHVYPKKEKDMVTLKITDNVAQQSENAEYSEVEKTQRGNTDQIVICFNRSPCGYSDVDYKCQVSTASGERPYFAVPGRGTISMRNAVPDTDSKDLKATCTVICEKGGGAQNEYTMDYTPYVFSQSETEWKYDMLMSWKQLFLGPNGSNSIKYDYKLEIIAPFKTVQGTKLKGHVIVTSTDEKPGSLKTVEKIPQLIFMWGCLAGESMVTMADGSKKPINEIKIDESVIATDGETARVINIWTGKENTPMVRLAYNGSRLLLTDSHPVLTVDGWRRANQLKVGDILIGENGEHLRLDELQSEMYSGVVYNLELCQDNEGELRGFLAEGLAVGDFALQNHCDDGGANG